MFGKRFHLITLFGFRVGLDTSWFLLAFLIIWSLAYGYFPAVLPGFSQGIYLSMGVAGALGLFASLIFHELAHALVARRYDLRISGITLFIFGGVAHMEEEPHTPKVEFLMAIAGPLASFFLAGFFALLGTLGDLSMDRPAGMVIGYLALINLVLAIFNLIPAFPLDGGRIFRSAMWWWRGNFIEATRIAAWLGAALGIALIAWGVYNIITTTLVGGMWQVLIGFFIFNAAQISRMQAIRRPPRGGDGGRG